MRRTWLTLYFLPLIFSLSAQTTESGWAAYYADYLQGQVTALGEIYDRHALTCAHRFHPKGTLLKVTSMDNNKSVVVRVNDRGPFTEGYVVDLSLAAAHAIDLTLSGKAMVTVEPVGFSEENNTPAPSEKASNAAAPATSSPPSSRGAPAGFQWTSRSATTAADDFNPEEVRRLDSSQKGYVIQIGAYNNKENAQNQIISIQKMGVRAAYLYETSTYKGAVYRVVLGIFDQREFAEQYRQRLKTQYQLNGLVLALK